MKHSMASNSASPSRPLARTSHVALSVFLAATLALPTAGLSSVAFADDSQQTSSSQTESSSSNKNESSSNQQAPEKPSGDNNNGSSDNQNGDSNSQPPAKPDGDNGNDSSQGSNEQNGQAPSGDAPGDQDGQAPSSDAPGGQGGPGGGANTQSFDYSGSYSATLTADGETLASHGKTIKASSKNTNAALAENGGSLTIANSTLKKSGSVDDGDSCNFYGVNSALLAVGSESSAVISDSSIKAKSTGSNAIFATNGANILAYNTSISTTKDNSRGLDATYGGTVVADSMSISTKGGHSAAVATDRGGGNVSLTNSTLSTAGSGSPLLYSTGCIEVNQVKGTSSGSQIAAMEGLNTLSISNSTLESTHTKASGSDPVANGVIIYQSTSGDAESSTGEAARFQATDSTLKSAITSGAMFYLTNTTANVVLKNTKLDFDSSKANLITATGNDANSWGKAGSNGATVNFTGINQTLEGTVEADTISTLNLTLSSGSSFTGNTTITTNNAGDATESPLSVNVSSDSTWTVTKDSTLTNLNIEDGGTVVDSSGKQVKIVDASGNTLREGDSSVTITVNGSLGSSFETSDAQALASTAIDRSSFDTQFSTETTYSIDGATASYSTCEVAEQQEIGTAAKVDTASLIALLGGMAAILIAGIVGFVLALKGGLSKKKD